MRRGLSAQPPESGHRSRVAASLRWLQKLNRAESERAEEFRPAWQCAGSKKN